MSERSIFEALKPFRRRLQWRDSLNALWFTLTLGLFFSCLLLLAGRLWPLMFPWQLLLIGGVLTVALVGLGQIFAWLQPRSWGRIAQLGDRRLGLEERLVTAVELAGGVLQTDSLLRRAQLDDALARLAETSLPQRLPLVKPKRVLGIAGLLLSLSVALIVLLLLPNPQQPVLQAEADLQELLDAEIETLAQIESDLLPETELPATGQLDELPATLEELVQRLEEARQEGSPQAALAALADAEQALAELQQQRQAQEEAFNDLAGTLAESGNPAAQQAAEALQRGQVGEAAEALDRAAQNPPTDPAEAAQLAETLEQAADSLAQSNPELAESMRQAAEALRSGDSQAAQEALEQAAGQLAEAGQEASGQDQMGEALENIRQARDQLAEQGTGEPLPGRQQAQGEGDGQGQGRGQQPGEGNGAGQRGEAVQGQGGGSGREDPGPGAEGLTSDRGANAGEIETDNGPNQGRQEDYNSVYAPEFLGGEGGPVLAPDSQGNEAGIDIGQTAPNPNRESGAATVPYQEVYREYRDQAGTALDNSEIPLGMRDYVRQYFGALEPE